MRLAFVTDELPSPGLAGHLAMNHAMVCWLRSQGHQLSILLVKPRLHMLVERYPEAPVRGIGVGNWRGLVFPSQPRSLARAVARKAMARLPSGLGARLQRRRRARHYNSAEAVLGAFVTAEECAWAAREISRLAPDGVIVDTIFRADLLTHPALAGLRTAIIAHDVFHRRHRALVSAGYRLHPQELSAESEAGFLKRADVIVAIQPEEAAEIARMCPGSRVITAVMPALPCPRPPQALRHPGRLVFVGSSTLPNLDGLNWFLAKVWPRLRDMRQDVSLDLVGECGAAIAGLPAGVVPRGRVKTLAPFLHGAALAIAPLRVGSGLKIKMLDYARHGLLTIATPEALQGFARTGAPFIEADTAEDFAQAIATALDRAEDCEALALAYVARHYADDAAFRHLSAALEHEIALKSSFPEPDPSI